MEIPSVRPWRMCWRGPELRCFPLLQLGRSRCTWTPHSQRNGSKKLPRLLSRAGFSARTTHNEQHGSRHWTQQTYSLPNIQQLSEKVTFGCCYLHCIINTDCDKYQQFKISLPYVRTAFLTKRFTAKLLITHCTFKPLMRVYFIFWR